MDIHRAVKDTAGPARHIRRMHRGEQLPDPASPQQASAVLTVLHRQQQQAIAQLDRLVNTLMDLDCEDSAMQLQKAVDDFSKGNLYLGLALSLLKEE